MMSFCAKNTRPTRTLAAAAAVSLMAMLPVAQAEEKWYQKPIVKQAAIGAAAGAAAGALTDRATVTKGALTGAVVGAGTGYMSTNDTLARKPLLRQTLKGALIGGGVGYAMDYGTLKGAAVGAVGGAGVHYVRKYVLDK